MNESTRAVIQATFEASNKGQTHFGEAIAQLIGIQVESNQRSGVSLGTIRDIDEFGRPDPA